MPIVMREITERFVVALGELHRSGDAAQLAELFADDAPLSKVGMPSEQRGKDGARVFWQQYRETFDAVDVSYRNTVLGDGIAVLEWTSWGTLRNGTDFSYDGVSVLEASGADIEAFRTYYDTAAFLGRSGQHVKV